MSQRVAKRQRRKILTTTQEHLARAVGIDPSRISRRGLIIGDAREQMAQRLFKLAEKVINEHQHLREPYYLLVSAKADGYGQRRVRTRLVVLPAQPAKLLGTMCFRVDNVSGRVQRLWVLPLDKPMPPSAISAGQPVKEIADDAVQSGIPILNQAAAGRR